MGCERPRISTNHRHATFLKSLPVKEVVFDQRDGPLMLKVVAWLVLIFLVLFALRMINVRKTRSRNRAATSAPATEAQAMVRCARCGVFLPRSDASLVAGSYTCADSECAKR
jgi:uncharacterized protein